MTRRKLLVGALAGAMVAVAAGTFLGVRWLDSDDPTQAAQPGTPTATFVPGGTPTLRSIPTPPGPDVTPEPGATPDTTQPWWYVPWINAERDKPLLDGTLAGIRIANGVSAALRPCAGESSVSSDPGAARGTPLDVSLDAVPSELILGVGPASVSLCDGQPYSAEAFYSLAPDAAWAPRGGSVQVYRRYSDPVASAAVPAWRWEERELAGMTVAVARPILDDLGLGESIVVAFRGGVVSVIRADSLTFDALLEVAREVLE